MMRISTLSEILRPILAITAGLFISSWLFHGVERIRGKIIMAEALILTSAVLLIISSGFFVY
ncbi:hypothetical protein [Salinispira pacifica]|uniref:Uncharacterized protein n=1 Tax=Salinispira pacifica TaxID=1307761 RepID=V5WHE7_9SPIO|nr:hypothetical protein [Salinispira pacifica]AHC14974.1 hypothetical protein L21SP2_1587 [Salinispira pacifica]